MNKKFLLIILLFNINQTVFAQRIAIATKSLGSVEIEKKEKPGFNKLKAGTILDDGDRIRTGPDGFALIIFIDDKSQLKIKEESEVTITGKKIATAISKNIRMDNGTVRAQVNKQRKGEFVIQSTTSVASVKGTDFWFIANSDDGDMLIGIEGIVDLFNVVSGLSVDVTAGNTGTSDDSGNLDVGPTNQNTVPDDPSDTEEDSGNQIEIEFEGPNGEIKKLLIDIQ
ncbi:MAG: FecR family protein [Candidatus Neomarinimicrobiota bacterium]|nr:FecR family protein [Candidatus Neomarinimicrobiota bacterium]|tara:strand:+ start:6 stop:683 length:678 start_codon:yes stop_codon:yes gene_type:complete